MATRRFEETFYVKMGVVGMAEESIATYQVEFDMDDPEGSAARSAESTDEALRGLTKEFMGKLLAHIVMKMVVENSTEQLDNSEDE